MKISYIKKRFSAKNLRLIQTANSIIDEYRAQGFDLTLRQIYYQMVARDVFPDERRWTWDVGRKKWRRDLQGTKNADPNYKWLGGLLNGGRLAGLVDWNAMVDRTRYLRENSHWVTPTDVLKSAAQSYLEDHWASQAWRPEVWIEKDALIGVIEQVCRDYDVPFFSCRGYTSQSAMWRAGHGRLRANAARGQASMIIHLADHDPSGINMTQDIASRLEMFAGEGHEVKRIALNMNQVEKFQPPPSPAKTTDSRAASYIARFGGDSWELDALEPRVLVALIEDTLAALIDPVAWADTDRRIAQHKTTLTAIADNYALIQETLAEQGGL